MPIDKRVFVGFDGFVDSIKKAVKQKQNGEKIFFKTIEEFSQQIRATTSKSGQVEMVTQRIKPGGSAPILSDALGRLGVPGFCVGSLGFPGVHSVFSNMSKRCEIISILDPGHSDAIEFEDGKIIFSDLKEFDDYNWEFISKTVGIKQIKKAIEASRLLAFVDWANIPHASDIWDGVLHDIIKPSGRRDFLFLFDLCDPSKKSTQEIDEVLDLMSCFSPYGKVTLGLNEKETLKIWAAINGVDINIMDAKIPPVKAAGEYIHKAMNIDYLLVHPIDGAILYNKDDTIELKGRLVTKAKVVTGGGDHLNAGYCLGLLYDLPLSHCVLLGMASSGAYIQRGTSPDFTDVLDYIQVWMEELNETEDSHNVVAVQL